MNEAPLEAEQPVGIEALWTHTVAAHAGWHFLLKWVLCLCGVGVVTMIVLTVGLPGRFSDPLMATVLGIAQGWPLFGWRWRTWMWSVWWVAAVILLPKADDNLGSALIYFSILAVGQMLLLMRVRHRFALWLMVSPLGLVACQLLIDASGNFLDGWISSFRFLFRLPAWVDASAMAVSIGLSAYFVILGVTLAWVMPPMAPATTPHNSH